MMNNKVETKSDQLYAKYMDIQNMWRFLLDNYNSDHKEVREMLAEWGDRVKEEYTIAYLEEQSIKEDNSLKNRIKNFFKKA